MHIAFASGGISLIRLSPNLKPEYSDSYSASLDFDQPTEHYIYGFTLSGFHTRLQDAFVLEETRTDTDGNMQLTKRNGGASTVKGVTAEVRFNYDRLVQVEAGLTVQESLYDEAVEWSGEVEGSRRYLRSPNRYGFYTLSYTPARAVSVSVSGVYTGPMLVPHFGGAPGVDGDRLETSPNFWETNFRAAYTFNLPKLKQELKFYGGVQNIFDAYQDDFDLGKNRDSNYVYGPARPRTFFVGVKWGR